jgi:hypothetical protein
MKRSLGLDFTPSRWKVTRLSIALMVATGLMLALVVDSISKIDQTCADIETVEHRIEQRERANEREALRHKRMSPQERHIEKVLMEQSMNATGSGISVIDRIEHAWTPEIALQSIVVDKAGRHVRIEGGAATLEHIYTFIDRLREQSESRDVGLLQHHSKVEGGRTIRFFTLSIEKP